MKINSILIIIIMTSTSSFGQRYKSQSPGLSLVGLTSDTIITSNTNRDKFSNQVSNEILPDKLFLLNPGFEDQRLQPIGQEYFCPFNAMLEGVLKYFPDLKNKLDISYVDFPRPRTRVAELVGEENQGLPILIIERKELDLSTINLKESNGKMFIQGAEDIVKYFNLAFGIPLPHP